MREILREFEFIVEYSYQSKNKQFVVRFLDGSSYLLKIEDLPKNLQTKKPEWDESKLSATKNSIEFTANGEKREIPFHMIHARGTVL